MRVLDLFSGIGGFSLGLERAGMQTVAFCEIEPWCRAILKQHWPHVPCYDDVRTVTADRLRSDGIVPNVICGGFPCQDISEAGKRAGIGGERSGLWAHIARLTDELRPDYLIVENVQALARRGLHRVLSDLALLGYDAEWDCVGADLVGAPSIASASGFWHTPTTRDYKGQSGAGNRKRRGRGGRLHIANLCDQIWDTGRLDLVRSPTFREWLMGLPIGHTVLKQSATLSSPRSRKSSVKP